MLRNLQDEFGLPVLNAQRVQDLRETILELDVHHGADNGDDLALGQRLPSPGSTVSPLCKEDSSKGSEAARSGDK